MRSKFILLLTVLSCMSCEELIEVEDISMERVTILAPANDLSLTEGEVNFSWDPLENAETYQLQIATPNFDMPAQILEDTIISTHSFTKALTANTYQWRVKALNFGYQTGYSTQNLSIED